MRCLYCGKELALLKRLTKGGEFCSEAHKQRYQEEYDRIALSRLLQAQKKVSTTGSVPSQPPAPSVPVEVQESVPEPAVPQAEAPAEISGFLSVRPTGVEITEEQSNAQPESWVEYPLAPVVPVWLTPLSGPALTSAAPLSLELVATQWGAELVGSITVLTGEICSDAGASLPTPTMLQHSQKRLLPFGQLVELGSAIKALNVDTDKIAAAAFPTSRDFRLSAVLELPPASIELAAEDAEVVIHRAHRNVPALDPPPAVTETSGSPADISAPSLGSDLAGENPATPHATLEALSRLHQVMQLEPDPLEKLTELVAVVTASPVETAATEPGPRNAKELIELPLKVFPPAKKLATVGNAIAIEKSILLPRLKALPLRPKIGTAPAGITIQDAIPQPREAEPSSSAQPVKTRSITTIESAPPQKIEQRAVKVSKEPSNGAPVAKLQQPSGAGEKRPRAAKQTGAPVAVAAAPAQVPGGGAVPKEVANSGKREQPGGDRVTATAVAAPPISKPGPPAPVAELPSFAGIGKPATSVGGSFKVTIGTVLLLIIGGSAAYFVWGTNRSSPKAVVAQASSSDPTSPSAMSGQSGWVTGWGAESGDAASGRDITIYRPSLKLSDYRIEFQGGIETKSMGWVFRATDPENYYAMKLSTLSTGVSPKVALFKYIVVKGHQTQVGRVPIDMDVRTDTLFKVRIDVRGSKFSTYVQGQPVDVWTDDQLKSGGVGFLNERGERGQIKSVSVRYLTGGDS